MLQRDGYLGGEFSRYCLHPSPLQYHGVCSCQGTPCGSGSANNYKGVGDEYRCNYNAYRMGAHDSHEAGKQVDTIKPFAVITQFVTSDGTSTGQLTQIKRVYIQGSKVIANAAVNATGIVA